MQCPAKIRGIARCYLSYMRQLLALLALLPQEVLLSFCMGKDVALQASEAQAQGGIRSRALLVKALAPLQLPVQLPLRRILQDQVHPRLSGNPVSGARLTQDRG